MLLTLDDYVKREMDPTAPFAPVAVHDELLRAMMTNPAAVIPADFGSSIVRSQTDNMLRLQQHLTYRIGAKLGFLNSIVPQIRGALQLVPPMFEGGIADQVALIAEAVMTGVGVAVDAFSNVPIIGWAVKVLSSVFNLISSYYMGVLLPGDFIGRDLDAAAVYSTDADASLANTRLMAQAETRDWTTLFTPSTRGQLAGRVLEDPFGRIVLSWGLADDGKVPRVVIDKRPISVTPKPYEWHFSESNGGPFTPSGGLGSVPGTARIVSAVQSTLIEPPMVKRGHESLGDPRCGSIRKTIDVDTGTYLPSTASGAWSLFGACTKAGAPAYTIATQEVVNAWQAYVDAIWEGIERLWRNPSWEGGWGCGPWQNALAGLARAHCVGADGQVGSFGAWEPTRYETKLTSADRNAWEASNLCTRIVKPAMIDLREMQLSLLRKTPMAAYLPATGLGSMRDVSVKEEFETARVRLLRRAPRNVSMRRELRRGDVVDAWYLEQLVSAGVGSDTASGGIEPGDYRPPRTAATLPGGGGGGRAAITILSVGTALVVGGLVIRARRRR